MSYFRRYDLTNKNTALQQEQSPGKYRKLTDDEVCTEWMRTRGKLSTSPPATPPLDHAKKTERQTKSSTYPASKIPTPKKTTRKHQLSESLLRTLKESNVDDIEEFNGNSYPDGEAVKSGSGGRNGGKMHALAIGKQSPGHRDKHVDLINELRQVQVDRVEDFAAKKKRHTVKGPTEKTSPSKKERQKATPASVKDRKFVLVANPCYTTTGMEDSNSPDRTAVPVGQSKVVLPDQRRNRKDAAVDATFTGRVSSLGDASPDSMGNQETKVQAEDVTYPQREEDITVPSSENDEEHCFFSEREVCANSSLNRSHQSGCSTSDDDTINSVSSDEVNVYVDTNGRVKDGVRNHAMESDQFGASTSRSFDNETMPSPEREDGRGYDGMSPSSSSEMAGGSTPEDARSLSHSSQEACSRSHERLVIPKIRINGDLPEDSKASNLSDQCTGTTGSQDVSIDTIDSMEGAITRRSQRSSIDSGTGSDPIRPVHSHFVVVAIDFGTTYSGYAFSFNREKEKIHIMRKWEGGDPGVINQKTLTTLLLTPDGKFHSFGFTARDTFHNLKQQESKKWHYFEKFKMVLHYSTDLNKETCLRSSNGSLVSALNVFTFALEFFKTHALQELSDLSGTRILNEDVRWVITVPAIWRAQAKQFMRQAAYQAGIASEDFPEQLLIALEPEAASVCCRKLRMYQVVPESEPLLLSPRRSSSQPKNLDHVLPEAQEGGLPLANNKTSESVSLSSFPQTKEADLTKGTRYMVVDCGGGTVDITVHEIQDSSGRLRELYKATGGPYGSVGVDIEFENLLSAIFGTDFIHHFRQKRPAGWDDLMIAFESRKRSACPDKVNPLNVSLPFSFIDLYKKTKGGGIEGAVRKYGDPHIRWSSQGMLRLSPDAMRRLFTPTLNRIKQTIGDIMNHPDARGLRYLFLVGGFAESRVLQSEIRKEFGHIVRVIIPQGVSLAILEGAVLFGWDPSVVNIRRSRLTYGIGVLNRFDPEKHPDDKRLSKNGSDWCTDVFECFVKVNQSVSLGDTVIRSYTPARPGQRSSIINIFCTERSDVKFVTDHGVRRCGTLCLDLSDCQYQPMPSRREIQTRMFFGDTEIKVTALDVVTGTTVRAGIDFLSK